MIQTLFILSLYRTTCMSTSNKYFTFYPEIAYGFKKDAKVSLNISNLTTQIVFGLATSKEKESIKSLESCLQFCDGQKKLSQIQFLIKNDTNLNFTIPSQNILTPFSISCQEMYTFEMSLDILNGKYHLDYRYNIFSSFNTFAIIVLISFSIIHFLIGIKLIVSGLSILYIIHFLLHALFVIVQILNSSMMSKNLKNEFVPNFEDSLTMYKFFGGFFGTNFIFVIIFSTQLVYPNLMSAFFNFVGMLALVFIVTIQSIVYFPFNFCCAAIPIYFVFVIFMLMLPVKYTSWKASFIINSILSFFYYVLRFLYFSDKTRQVQECQTVFVFNIIYIFGQLTVSVVFMFDDVKKYLVLKRENKIKTLMNRYNQITSES